MYKIYYLYGEEDFLIDEEVKKIIKEALALGFSLEKFDARAADFDAILQSLMGDSLFSAQKLILIDNFDQARADDAQMDNFLSSLKQSDSDRIVVMLAGALDKRKKLYKVLNACKGVFVSEFKVYTEWQEEKVAQWIAARAAKLGKKINSAAALCLLETSGANLRLLNSEIEKLITFVGQKDFISEEDIEQVSSSKHKDVFALLESLRAKKIDAAIRLINGLLADREEPTQLLGLLLTQYKLLLQMKILQKDNLSCESMARRIHASPYFAKKTFPYLNNFTLEELKGVPEKLSRADLDLKLSARPANLTFELLFTDLCAKSGRGSVYA